MNGLSSSHHLVRLTSGIWLLRSKATSSIRFTARLLMSEVNSSSRNTCAERRLQIVRETLYAPQFKESVARGSLLHSDEGLRREDVPSGLLSESAGTNLDMSPCYRSCDKRNKSTFCAPTRL